ncbi:MAG: hypothetical protein R3C05_04500 [Pirellulaceae bacterium]
MPTLFRLPNVSRTDLGHQELPKPQVATEGGRDDAPPPKQPILSHPGSPEPSYERIDPGHEIESLHLKKDRGENQSSGLEGTEAKGPQVAPSRVDPPAGDDSVPDALEERPRNVSGTVGLQQENVDADEEAEVDSDTTRSSELATSIPTYDELPELPRIDEPAGRSWMETVGSRLVLILLFLAVATVAIMATNDIPPVSQESLLAETAEHPDQDFVDFHVTDASPEPSSDTAQAVASYPSADTFKPTNGNVQPTLNAANTGRKPQSALHADEMETGLPKINSIDEIDSLDHLDASPSDRELPSFPMPEMAKTSTNSEPVNEDLALPNLAESTTTNTVNNVDAEANLATDERTSAEGNAQGTSDFKQPAEPTTSGSAVEKIATSTNVNPNYARTDTPHAITDWSAYIDRNAMSVGYQQPSSGNPIPTENPMTSANQFNYPTDPVQPSPLNQQPYPPYSAMQQQMVNEGQALPPSMPVYTPGQGYEQAYATWMQQQQALQQQGMPQQQGLPQQQGIAGASNNPQVAPGYAPYYGDPANSFGQPEAYGQPPVNGQPTGYGPTAAYGQATGYGQSAGYAPQYGYGQTQPQGVQQPVGATDNFGNPSQSPYGNAQPYYPNR